MQLDYYYIMRSILFDGLGREEVEGLMGCLDPDHRLYVRGEHVFRPGERITRFGFVLDGAIRVEAANIWGERTLLVLAEPGKTFAEAYACAPGRPLLVDIVADRESEVLLFDVARLMHTCPLGCERHRTAATNFTRLLALRNIELSRRAFVTAPLTIREKVLSYLSLQATEQGGLAFDIPLNRAQMAEYLGVDRSALSAELSRMKAEGLIDYRLRHFVLSRGARVD